MHETLSRVRRPLLTAFAFCPVGILVPWRDRVGFPALAELVIAMYAPAFSYKRFSRHSSFS